MPSHEGQPEADRDIRGNNIVDREDIEAYLRATAKPDNDAPRPADEARAALQEAQERAQSGTTKAPEPSWPIAERHREAGRTGIEQAREQLKKGPDPDDELEPPTLPDPRG